MDHLFNNWIDSKILYIYNTYFLLVLRLSSNGQAQTWKALYVNAMISNDIKLMNFLLAALTVLRVIGNPLVHALYTGTPEVFYCFKSLYRQH